MNKEEKIQLMDLIAACQWKYHIMRTTEHRFSKNAARQLHESQEQLVAFVEALTLKPGASLEKTD